MKKWTRFFYQPCLPLGRNGERVTGGKEHIALSRKAAAEGMVLLKNEQKILPLLSGAKVALFGKGCVDYVKGGGGSGDVTVEYIRSLLAGMRCKAQEGRRFMSLWQLFMSRRWKSSTQKELFPV